MIFNATAREVRIIEAIHKIVVAISVLILILFPVTASAQTRKPSPNPIAVSDEHLVLADMDGRPLIEPHLAIDPDNDAHLALAAFVASADLTKSDCIALASFDSGQNWMRHDFGLTSCADPWIAILPGGAVLLTVIAGDDSEILVYRSEDGGHIWSKPLSLGAGHDHETFVVKNGEGKKQAEIYLTSAMDTEEPGAKVNRTSVVVRRSLDGGKTFLEPVRLFPSSLSLNSMNPVVSSDGTLVVLFGDFAATRMDGSMRLKTERSWILRSSDQGKSFNSPVFVSEECAKSWEWLAVDKSSGPFRDRLYSLCTDGSYEHVLFQYSPDGGEQWSRPLYVNQVSGVEPYVRTPMMAVNREGIVGISWYDGRSDRAAYKQFLRCQEIYFSASLDGGITFLPEVKVGSKRSCPLSPKNGDAGIRWPAGGDYSGLATDREGRFHLLWSDSRNGVYQLWTATVTVHGEHKEGKN